MKVIIAILAALCGLFISDAQANAQTDYRYEIGAGAGMSGYIGDASSNLWKSPGADGELLFRYIMNPRMALKTSFYALNLSGNTEKMSSTLPGGEALKFSTALFEISEAFEFNFFNFGMGETYRKLRRWTPYITAGLGMALWRADRETSAAFIMPLGAGLKFKVSKRLNLGFEFLMKKAFSDKVDGSALADPVGIKSSFAKNTDWYSTMTLTVSYEFGLRCATCNYKD